MAKRAVIVRLTDILAAIDDAIGILDGDDFGAYRQSVVKKRAVERCVEIISEASRHIPDEMTSQHPSIPWAEIRSIGNLLRHEYQRVDDHVMWMTVKRYLPELRVAVASLIGNDAGSDKFS